MSIDALNDDIARGGGSWVKLRTKEDPPVEGVILAAEKRDRTDPEGNVVYKRGTQTPRTEWVFTLQTEQRDGDEDDGVRKVPCNEGAQIAVREAVKAGGGTLAIGGTLKIGVKEDPEDSYKQATYIARYTPPVATVEAFSDDEAPF